MAEKKYLSLEEAAAILKIKTEELIRLREKGEVRGFGDRGTWKFRSADIEEFARRRQPDSDPDVAILDDDEDDVGRQATVIRKGRDSSSDSDVRLVLDEGLKKGLTGSSDELPVVNLQSDSDVTLVRDSAPRGPADSDSDVKLVSPVVSAPDSDSDVKLVTPVAAKPGSDSDVKLVEPRKALNDSDSDVRLAQSDSDVKLVPPRDSDSDVKLIDQAPGKQKRPPSSDSDVALLPVGTGGLEEDSGGSALFDDDPGITLPGDSGIQLSGDSGIKLVGDSGIRLSEDSGIQLHQPADSGILLEGDSGLTLDRGDSSFTLAEGSGLKLRGGSSKKLKGGSSKNLKRPADLEATAPMMLSQDEDELQDLSATAPMLLHDDLEADLEVPLLSDDEDNADTSVIMFDDEESADQTSATVVKKGGRKPVSESFDLEESEELAEEDELEVSDEVLGEDDELEDLDAFESDEDEFDESFEAGASRIGFGAARKIAAPREVEWGTGFFLSLLASSAILLVGALMSADLLRTTWAGDKPVYQGELIDKIGDALFKK